MYEYDLKYVYVELSTLQEFLDIGDQVNGIEIRIDDPNQTESVMEELGKILGPNYRIQDWRDLNRSLFSALKLEKIAMFIVLAIIILVASFSIVGNLVMIVMEKAREIAVIKTLGATDRTVTDIFIGQGFVIGLIGMLSGVSLGLYHTMVTLEGFPLDPNVYYIDQLPINLEPLSVLYVALASIVISSLATIYPASLAASQRPVEGLARE
jgi:lipoprotein-releasing system permease protein